jgi:glycosyltransferase involved in cell wall biosynthesis
MYLLYDENQIIRIVSSNKVKCDGLFHVQVEDNRDWNKLIYKKLPVEVLEAIGAKTRKAHADLRVAIICNWNDRCGISTYSSFLVNALKSKVNAIKIFSEFSDDASYTDEPNVVRCWKRGEDLEKTVKLVKEWSPDFVIIQHEYGIFPNAFKFMQLMSALDKIPYAVVMHSVYHHLDKAVYSESAKNIIVHSNEAKSLLRTIGNTNNIYVVPHGCVQFKETQELWNICVNPYTILQFGFGFAYKGVDRALHAIAHLKAVNNKYENLQYIYLCSTNSHNYAANAEYCKKLTQLAKDLGILPNIVIIQKYQTEEMINLYLRLGKIAIFPYVIDPQNEVFGASGAIRIALANKRPVIASESHLFDDLEGIVPRPTNHIELAKEIDKIFSQTEYRDGLVEKSFNFVKDTSWDVAAQSYLAAYDQIVDQL